MAVNLAERLEARRLARFHVQVELEPTSAPSPTPGLVPIAGRVRRIFKGDDQVSVGDPVTFSVNVCRRGEDTPPGAAYLLADDLRRATYIEVYLNGTPPRYQMVLDECAILSGPRDDALMADASVDVLMSAGRSAPPPRPSRWWRFWDV